MLGRRRDGDERQADTTGPNNEGRINEICCRPQLDRVALVATAKIYIQDIYSLPRGNHVDRKTASCRSLGADQVGDVATRSPLAGHQRVDVAIVGAGTSVSSHSTCWPLLRSASCSLRNAAT